MGYVTIKKVGSVFSLLLQSQWVSASDSPSNARGASASSVNGCDDLISYGSLPRIEVHSSMILRASLTRG
eukprot:520498-Amphidinium_carterae.1